MFRGRKKINKDDINKHSGASYTYCEFLFIAVGKYGYFDGEKVRVVEYGADRHGFQPSGDGITVSLCYI